MSNRYLELAILLLVVIYFLAWYTPIYASIGSLIHILLALIVIIAIFRIMQGKKPLAG
jgi:hypothetical protein